MVMEDSIKRMIREQVANGNLTSVIELCISECFYQQESADSHDNELTEEQLYAITKEWHRQEKYLDHCRYAIEQGHPY